MLDEILGKYDLKIEDLSKQERDIILGKLEKAAGRTLSIEDVKDMIRKLILAVERELITTPEFEFRFIFKIANRQQLFLKARLANYLQLETILTAPDKAQKMLEDQIKSSIAQKRNLFHKATS